jgi:hypothetical protein
MVSYQARWRAFTVLRSGLTEPVRRYGSVGLVGASAEG